MATAQMIALGGCSCLGSNPSVCGMGYVGNGENVGDKGENGQGLDLFCLIFNGANA